MFPAKSYQAYCISVSRHLSQPIDKHVRVRLGETQWRQEPQHFGIARSAGDDAFRKQSLVDRFCFVCELESEQKASSANFHNLLHLLQTFAQVSFNSAHVREH